MKKKTLGELAEYVGGKVVGPDDVQIGSAATLQNAQPDQITFLSNKKYIAHVKTTKAGAIIADKPLDTNVPLLIADNPYYAFTQILVLLHGHREHKSIGVSKLASIASTAQVGQNCHIYDFAVICDDVVLGKECIIYPGAFIGPGASLGDRCIVYPNAVIYDGCKIGNRVIIHACACIGQDGFGFAPHKGEHYKIPQIGKVILEDDVEIGACAAIERGTLDDTVIGQGSKVGDLVAIGHGTRIGPHCLLVPQVGVAGSATIGHHCVMGGQAGIVGHITIGNMVKIGAQAGVINDVPDGATIVGAPAIDANKAKRAYSLIQYLPEMRRQLKDIQKKLDSDKSSGKHD